MRRVVAVCGAAVLSGFVAMTAAHADGGTDFSVANVGGVVYVAAGATAQGTIAIDVSGPAAPATLTLSFPTGLSLGANGVYPDDGSGSPLDCVPTGQRVVCAVPSGAEGSYFVDVTASATAAVGATTGVGVDIEPVAGTDPNPGNNTATVPVTVIPTAKLNFVLAAPSVSFRTTRVGSVTLPTGVQTHLTCTVTSAGPDTVSDLVFYAFQFPAQRNDWIVRLTPNGAPISGPTQAPLGTLRPDDSRTLDLYVTPKVRNETNFVGCQVDSTGHANLIEQPIDRAGDFGVGAKVTAGVPTPPSPSSNPSSSASSSIGALAYTGVDTTGLGGLAALLLAAGAGALYLGRRRPSGRHLG